jgi:hypothetical protein
MTITDDQLVLILRIVVGLFLWSVGAIVLGLLVGAMIRQTPEDR